MHKKLPKIFIFLDKYEPKILNYNITNIGVIYRNYKSKQRYSDLIKISNICKKKKYKLFVSNDLKLALKVRAYGIYIPSFVTTVKKYLILGKNNIQILGSAHNQKEILNKIKQGCRIIFLSPLFKTKKNRKNLGVIKFNLLAKYKKVNFYALGGITEKNFSKLKQLNIEGFGGISLFQKKTGLKIIGRFFK